jgi:hypothetical protein
MRLLAVLALVLASLVFSAGGVAVVGRADSSAQPPGQSPVAPPQGQVVDKCAPKHFEMHVDRTRLALPNDAVPLNTRGYNYPDIGEAGMDPTGHTSGSDSQPPAAPAKP